MLDILGAIVQMAVVVMLAVVVADTLCLTLRQKLVLGAVAGGWTGLATGLAGAGALAFMPNQPVPIIGLLFATPLVAAAIAWRTSPAFRARAMAVPLPLLIGLHGARVLGAQFLLLAMAGRLSGPFPYLAAIGDILTGVAAIRLAAQINRTPQGPFGAVAAWNLFGALDLLVAVGLGISSIPGSPLQLIHAGVGSRAIQYLPYALIPTVLVPVFLVMHGIIAIRLRTGAPALARFA